jgi:hypothetical protein
MPAQIEKIVASADTGHAEQTSQQPSQPLLNF